MKANVIFRFGAMPVSKALTIFLKENHQAEQFVIDGAGGWRDPVMHLSTEMIYCNESKFCQKLVSLSEAHGNQRISKKWLDINSLSKENMTLIKDTIELSEGRLFYSISRNAA